MNIGIVTEFTVWATTSVSMPEATPGIGIMRTEVDGTYREDTGLVSDWATDDALWGLDADDDTRLDEGAADMQVADLGWRRIGDWTDSGGQWAATVESLPDASIQSATMVLYTQDVANGTFPVEIFGDHGADIDETPAGRWPASDEADVSDIVQAAVSAGWTVGEPVAGHDVRFPMTRCVNATAP